MGSAATSSAQDAPAAPGRSHGLVGRLEHGQRLIAAQLDHAAASGLDRVAGELGEPLSEPRGSASPRSRVKRV